MFCDHPSECGPRSVCGVGEEIFPEMVRPQAVDKIDETSEQQRPRGLKVKIPTPAVLVGQHIAIACRDGGPRRRGRYLEQGHRQRIAHFAPIETRVGDEDLNSRDQQS